MTLHRLLSLAVLALSSTTAWAAPTLRLRANELRPVWIQQGTNGPTNTVFEAYNIGDGALTLTVRASHTWLTPSIDAERACSFDLGRRCRPIRVLFASSSLAAGTYAGVITVIDPSAFDAPQSARILVSVGTNVPSRLDLFLPPEAGAKDALTFQTPTGPPPSVRGTTQSGGNWLAVSTSGMGSFQFVYTHTVQATVLSGMAPGDFNGTVTVANSSFTTDNKTVNVVMHVTEQPIARASTTLLQLLSVQGGSTAEGAIALSNAGRGTLTVSEATAAGGPWLTAAVQESGALQVRAEPGSLVPGLYSGTITIASNAANTVVVPVEFEVQAPGPPVTDFGGVVDAASFSRPSTEGGPFGPTARGVQVAAGALASLFGAQLAPSVAQAAEIPLPVALAETSVFVNNVPAPLIFVSPRQINFQMPVDVSGTAQIRVERQGQRGNTITLGVGRRFPGLYFFAGTAYGIAINATRGEGSVVFALPNIPAFAGVAKAAARSGDVLILYGSGLGPVSPAVATGTAAPFDPVAKVFEIPKVNFGRGFQSVVTDPQFVGLTAGFVGLFQINVEVPPGLAPNPRNPLRLEFPDGTVSNIVEIAVER